MQKPQILRPWWYLSFAGDDGWLGGTLVRGFTPQDAVNTSHLLEINPAANGIPCAVKLSGPLTDAELDERGVTAMHRERLLTRDEIDALPGGSLKWED